MKTKLDTIICPGCGWTGNLDGLGEFGECPECNYENGEKPFRLLTVDEILKESSGIVWHDVDLPAYTDSLLRHFGVIE